MPKSANFAVTVVTNNKIILMVEKSIKGRYIMLFIDMQKLTINT